MTIHYSDVVKENTYVCGDCGTQYKGEILLSCCSETEDLECPACGYWFDYEIDPEGHHV